MHSIMIGGHMHGVGSHINMLRAIGIGLEAIQTCWQAICTGLDVIVTCSEVICLVLEAITTCWETIGMWL